LSFGHLKEDQFWWSIQKKPNYDYVLRKSPIFGMKNKEASFGYVLKRCPILVVYF
jgi:hypothetical protein